MLFLYMLHVMIVSGATSLGIPARSDVTATALSVALSYRDAQSLNGLKAKTAKLVGPPT